MEEHSNTNRIPYLFNGKELDEETGLYYYGARYYDARTSVFVSVDPLTDQFPSLSPYQFAGNQVPNAIDLDGLEPVRPGLIAPRTNFRQYNMRDNGRRGQTPPPSSRGGNAPTRYNAPLVSDNGPGSGEYRTITEYKKGSNLKPGTGTLDRIGTPELDLETGGNTRQGRMTDAIGDLIENMSDIKKVMSENRSGDQYGLNVTSQETNFVVDPITYSKLQTLEKEYDAKVTKQAMGNLSSKEYAALPDAVKGLRRSMAGTKLGGSPMANFQARIQEMIKDGKLVPGMTVEQRQTIIRSKD